MTQLGKYELYEQLGRGGYGTVYRARDTVLDVERAVKVRPLRVAASAPQPVLALRRSAN